MISHSERPVEEILEIAAEHAEHEFHPRSSSTARSSRVSATAGSGSNPASMSTKKTFPRNWGMYCRTSRTSLGCAGANSGFLRQTRLRHYLANASFAKALAHLEAEHER
jgi:hypothetical protein